DLRVADVARGPAPPAGAPQQLHRGAVGDGGERGVRRPGRLQLRPPALPRPALRLRLHSHEPADAGGGRGHSLLRDRPAARAARHLPGADPRVSRVHVSVHHLLPVGVLPLPADRGGGGGPARRMHEVPDAPARGGPVAVAGPVAAAAFAVITAYNQFLFALLLTQTIAA